MKNSSDLNVSDDYDLKTRLIRIGFQPTEMTKPAEIYNCLRLFETKTSKESQAVIIRNPNQATFFILLNNRSDHFAFSLNEEYRIISREILPGNKSNGQDTIPFSEKYVVIIAMKDIADRFQGYWPVMDIKIKILRITEKLRVEEELLAKLNRKQISGKTDFNLNDIMNSRIRKHKKELENLNRQYDQAMISRLVKGGIQDDEMSQWWMNRY